MISRTAPKSRRLYKHRTRTCLVITPSRGATTRRTDAERATSKTLDKGIKDTTLAPPSSTTNPTSTRTGTQTLDAPIRTNSNRTPTNYPWRSKQILRTPTSGRAAAKQAAKTLVATKKGKLKTSTRTTTNASNPTTSTTAAARHHALPYLYPANSALPPMAPRVHFNHDQSVSNHFALNTKIVYTKEIHLLSRWSLQRFHQRVQRNRTFHKVLRNHKQKQGQQHAHLPQQRNLREARRK